MRKGLVLAAVVIALSSPAAAENAQAGVVSAFNRTCTDTAAIANDPSFEGAMGRLRAEGEAIELADGFYVDLSAASLQLRRTPERGAPGPWICQVVLPGANVRVVWRDWLRLRGIENQRGSEVTFIRHEALTGVMIVERREVGGAAVLFASPLGN